MSRVTLGLGIVVGWLLLWGDISVANVLSGVLVVVVVGLVFPSARPVRPSLRFRPVAIARLLAFLVRQLVVSNAQLSVELLRRRREIRSEVVGVPLRTISPSVTTAVCNLSALSPATLVVGLEDGVLLVHVLVFGGREDPADGVHTIRRFEELVVRAVGDADDVAALDVTPPVARVVAR